MTTFFAKLDPSFVPPEADGTIRTEPFLKAAKQIVPFIDILGTAFKIVKSDIDGNITRLTKRYESNPEKFPTLRLILDDEIERKCSKNSDSATQGLLWLKRALEYISLFLKLIAEDPEKSENLGPVTRKAYDETLKKYHGWMVQKLFAMVSLAVPSRNDFLKCLLVDKSASEDDVVNDIKKYLGDLDVNLSTIQTMYTDLNLDFQDKV